MYHSLISKIKEKDKKALSKAISIVENRLPGYNQILSQLFSYKKESHKIGITGPPGSGKSTITNKLSEIYLKNKKNIGILCVDPSSPFSGGAILGDRIRMSDVHMSDNIFIRSIGSRGSYGGLSDAVSEVEILYEAFGFDFIIYETVGVGQIEIDIVNHCDTVILTLTPESGDDIQMMKTGLIECANIIVINKSDRPGADKLNTFLIHYLEEDRHGFKILPIKVIALTGEGLSILYKQIESHYKFLLKKNIIIEKNIKKYKNFILKIASKNFINNFLTKKREKIINTEISKPLKDRLSPHDLFEKIK